MKMVKSLLLGTAAGLVAIVGAQAADLPVKAKPVQYVKICSLYGVGFYYIPGTDTCIKIGGFVRNETGINAGGSFATYVNGANGVYDRVQESWSTRTRTAITLDTRSQTAYGTLRSYWRGGFQWSTADAALVTSNNNITYFDRGFIQIAGFTTGKTASFYDFFSHPTYSYQTQLLAQESGGAGTNVFAYTATLGNGLSATISLEDSSFRRAQVIDITAVTPVVVGAFAGLAATASDAIGSNAPEIVGNLRIDQAWGSAQIQAAAHLVGARAYGAGGLVTTHPSDKWGTAIGAGISVNLPMIGAGDTIAVAANWCNGASRYCANPTTGVGTSQVFGIYKGGASAVGEIFDASFVTGGALNLSRTWSVSAGFQHIWSPQWRTSLYGQYLDFDSNSGTFDATVCAARAGLAPAGCADFSGYQIGSRTQWSPVANLDVGVDVMYTKANTAYAGGTSTVAVNGGAAAAVPNADRNIWSGFFRVQRNFWP